jgi:hypothetical protein
MAMTLSAGLNLLLGIRPQLLYRPDAVPRPTYVPYRLGKVVENGQVLLFTALAFWLLLPKLHAKAIVSVDTDWVYRKLPHLLRDADLQRHLPRRIPSPPAASADRLGPGLDRLGPGPDRRGPGLDRRGRASTTSVQVMARAPPHARSAPSPGWSHRPRRHLR